MFYISCNNCQKVITRICKLKQNSYLCHLCKNRIRLKSQIKKPTYNEYSRPVFEKPKSYADYLREENEKRRQRGVRELRKPKYSDYGELVV